MERRQKQVIEAYRRVQVFMQAHPLPEPASYARAGAMLDDVLAQVMVQATRQAIGRRQAGAEMQRQRHLVRMLRDRHLRPISKIATAVLRGAPGIEVALQIPRRATPTVMLLAESMGIRAAVTAYAPVLMTHGRPENFLAELDAAIEAVRQTLDVRSEKLRAKVDARIAIVGEMQRGRNAVEMIDATVVANFAGNPDVMASWRTARRVHATRVGTIQEGAASTSTGAELERAA